jgi:hypothetical protein
LMFDQVQGFVKSNGFWEVAGGSNFGAWDGRTFEAQLRRYCKSQRLLLPLRHTEASQKERGQKNQTRSVSQRNIKQINWRSLS